MIEKKQSNKTEAACIILLVILAVILISPALMNSKRILCPADSLNQWHPYNFVNPMYDIPPKNNLLVDQVLQFIPWKMYTQYWMARGVIPLWNHYQYCGAPFVGNSQSAIFSPVNLATVIFNIRWNLIISALLKLWIAGIGMYLFLRRIKLESASAFFGGVAFMFSGFNILWLGHPHTNIFVWLPWLLLATENLSLSSSWRDIGILGILIGIALLGGHPETEFLVLLVWGLYAGYRILISNYEETTTSRILNLSIALFLGLLIASIQWLPSAEYIMHSSAYHQRISGGTMQDSQAKRAILTWLFPNIFGHPLLHNIWVKNELIYQFNYNEAVSNYIGVITVLFAAVGIFYKDRLPYSRFFIGLSLFAAIISYRVPVIGPLLSKIPPISLIHPKRMIIITSFALIVLAAQRMNMVVSMEIRKKDVREKRKYISILWAIGICFSLISLNLYQCSLTFIDKGFHSISQLPLQEYGPTVIAALQQGSIWLVVSLSVLTAVLFTRWNPRVKVSLILIVLIADLLSFGWNYNPVVPARYLFPSNNPVANSIKVDQSQFRIISMNEWTVYPPNTAMADGLEDVRGYDAVVPERYEQFFQMAGLGFWKDPGPRIWQTDTTGEERALRVLNFLNVKYLLSQKEIPTQKLMLLQGVKPWKDSYRYLNPQVQPRVFICRNLEYSISPREILYKLQQPGFKLQEKLMIEANKQPVSIDSVYSGETVSLEIPNPNEMVLTVKMVKDGMVGIVENFDPGWSGTLKGKTIKPDRAQYAFMAVALPAGEYQFTLHYRPESFYFGVIFSLIGWALALFLIIFNRKKQ